MTKSDFADLMLGRRFSPALRKALELVLVDAVGQTESARLCGIHKQQINRAVKSITTTSGENLLTKTQNRETI
jgi:hypothetical protein